MVPGGKQSRNTSDRTDERPLGRRRSSSVGRSDRSGARGQTTLDFAVGVSVLLLTLATVFLFVPGALGVFTEGGQENIGSANRIASSLSEGLLGDPTRPHLLNRTCTVEFFDDNSPSHCRHTGANLSDRVGLNQFMTANVTLQSNLSIDSDDRDILCWDDDDSILVERDNSTFCDGNYVDFRIGSTPPTGSATTVTARRIVEIEGIDATLLVEVW